MTIKYIALTTVQNSLESFVMPLMYELKKYDYELYVMSNMDEKFKIKHSKVAKCINIPIERGFKFFNMIKAIYLLIKEFKKIKPDIIQYGTPNMAFCASIAAFYTKVPIRIYEHWGARYIGYKGIKRYISKLIEFIAALCSTDIRQVSYENMKISIQDGIYKQEKVKVLGKGGTIGVNFDKFNLERKDINNSLLRKENNIPKDAVVFGFTGRIQRDKGINELFDAFKKLLLEYRDKEIYLILIGPIDIFNPVDKDKMQWAQKCKQVIFTGFSSEVEKYMAIIDILVHPSYREGFGMVLQEAAALRIPIITTNIPGPNEFIENKKTGILVEPGNADELYEAMKELLINPIKRDLFGKNIFEYTKKYFDRNVKLKEIKEDRELLINTRLSKKIG